ncbi:MAG: methionine--tRNA ligase subunit beta [Candidatus Diapherotrites archaeon]
MVSFQDFKKIELKAAKILKAEDIPGKDKLYKLKIDLGGEQRTIVAGIKQFYSATDLEGKTIVVVANLEPATIAGIKSEAMLLAAENIEGKYSLVTIDGNIKPGTKVE